ncbi:Hsp20/alpha crystallin family protein [Flaviflagellibacter deserti]|uniref:Hsp20/alpha crystallin family protein n=1 Tax=Flaviflagellibacter deserti TaxID=2267266 RepID=A0ABV9YYQ9_9HYPH
MNVRDLIPWGRSNHQAPTIYRDSPTLFRDDEHPFLSLHREMNRLFDDVFRSFGSLSPLAGSPAINLGWPNVEVNETDKELRVIAELPGLDENDVEVLLDDGILTLRGERRSETEDRDRQFSERFYGRFERRIPVGEIEESQVNARFKNGVLTVMLPKSKRAQSQVKRIEIKH